VREDEIEARLVVEAEYDMKLERFLFVMWSSSSFSSVFKENEEMLDRRLMRLRSLLPSSVSSLLLVDSFSLSSSPEEEEQEDLGKEMRMPPVPLDMVDGGDGEGGEGNESEVVSES
jgi:hypothetical protein